MKGKALFAALIGLWCCDQLPMEGPAADDTERRDGQLLGRPETAEDEVRLDVRALAFECLPDGRRRRVPGDAVAAILETTWDNWPVHGPRSSMWCVRQSLERDHEPLAHHMRFEQNAGLLHHHAGVAIRRSAMRAIERALTYDQEQASELARLKIVARQAQLAELMRGDRVLGSLASREATILEVDHLPYLGTGSTCGQLMFDPKLEEYVAREPYWEAAVAKECCKMHDERSLQRPPPNPEGGKGGGKKQ